MDNLEILQAAKRIPYMDKTEKDLLAGHVEASTLRQETKNSIMMELNASLEVSDESSDVMSDIAASAVSIAAAIPTMFNKRNAEIAKEVFTGNEIAVVQIHGRENLYSYYMEEAYKVDDEVIVPVRDGGPLHATVVKVTSAKRWKRKATRTIIGRA